MHRLEFTRRALQSMRPIPQDRVRQIIGALEELAAMTHPIPHRNLKAMKGDWEGSWRMRVGSYRVILSMQPDPAQAGGVLLILVTAVGPRGDIYKG